MSERLNPIILERPSPEAFRRELLKNKPIKLLGVTAEWPLLKLLRAFDDDVDRLNCLSGIWGEMEVGLTVRAQSDPEDLVTYDGKRFAAVDLPILVKSFAEFCEMLIRELAGIGAGEEFYVQSNELEGLGGAVHSLPILEGIEIREDRLWMGNGARTHLHYDQGYNIINVLNGQKRVFLVPPGHFEELAHLPMNVTSNRVHFSPADYFHSDRSKFTEFGADKVPYYDFVLGPGESLFLPPLWWHQVESTGINIAVQGWASAHGSVAFEEEMLGLIARSGQYTKYDGWIDALFDDGAAVSDDLPADLRAFVNKARPFFASLPTDIAGRSSDYWIEYARDLLHYHSSDAFKSRFAAELEVLYEGPGDEVPVLDEEDIVSTSALVPFPEPDVSKWENAQCHERDGMFVVEGAPPVMELGHVVRCHGKNCRVVFVSEDEQGSTIVAIPLAEQKS